MDTKNWWESRTVWSSVVVIIATLAGLAGKQIGDQSQLIDALTAVGTIGGSIAAAYFRFKANTIIGSKSE